MPHLLKGRKYVMKYVVEQSEHFEKQNAVVFRKVILVGKPTMLLKRYLCYAFRCVQREVMFLHV